MKSKDKVQKLIFIYLRYLFLLIFGFSLYSETLYNLLLKFTLLPVYYLIKINYPAQIIGLNLVVNNKIIELIPACLGISALFLFVMLNFMTEMNWKKRVGSLCFLFLSFLIINIIRIFIFSLLFIENFTYFYELHKISWYSLNVLIVVILWFLSVFLFRIKKIPVYDDFKYILSLLKIK